MRSGGVSQGLIHISELSWDRIAKPEQVVSVGQSIQAVVTNVDTRRERITLSLRRLEVRRLPPPRVCYTLRG